MPLLSAPLRAASLGLLSPGLQSLALGMIDSSRVRYRANIDLAFIDTGLQELLPVPWDGVGVGLLPLWHCDHALMIRHPAGIYYEYEMESPEESSMVAKSDQGVMFYTLYFVFEDMANGIGVERAIEDLGVTASQIGFEHLAKLGAFYDSAAADGDCVAKLIETALRIP